MAVYSWMSAPDVMSDAAFRKWVKGVHDAFIGCGWAQSADTGQITNIGALTVPTAQNTAAGYHVFVMTDDMQATCPVYVKVEYGRGATINNSPLVWVTVGQGSNGAGALTGVLLPRTQTTTLSGSGTGTEYPSYASCDGGGFALAMWSGYQGQASWFLAVERSRTGTGEPTSEALLIVFGCAGGSTVNVVGNGGGGGVANASGAYLPVALPHVVNGQTASVSTTLSKDGSVAPVFPVPCVAPSVTPWVSNILAVVHPADAGATSVIQAATINGATRIFRAWTAFNSSSGTVITTSANAGFRCWPAIHWEVED